MLPQRRILLLFLRGKYLVHTVLRVFDEDDGDVREYLVQQQPYQ